MLPDGSVLTMNAASSLKYHPYWFNRNRKLKFEGEGYFNVEPGKQFLVKSGLAETRVIGTSFTIYSRVDEYRLNCHSGIVEVMLPQINQYRRVEKNQEIRVHPDGFFLGVHAVIQKDEPHWADQVFEYTGIALSKVWAEIERQYGVEIIDRTDRAYYYTGDFSSKRTLEASLNLVCKPFKITFVEIEEGIYHIVQEDQNP